MFKKNTIGEKINNILVKNDIKALDGSSFEQAVKKSSRCLKDLMNLPYDENKKKEYFGELCSNESTLVEFFILYVIGYLENIKHEMKTLDYNDSKVIWFINHAFYRMLKNVNFEIEPPNPII